MNIPEDLWNGNLCPISEDCYRANDYQELVKIYERNEGKLLPSLNDLQKDTFEKMVELIAEMRNISECNAFITGFRLAAQLMAVSMANETEYPLIAKGRLSASFERVDKAILAAQPPLAPSDEGKRSAVAVVNDSPADCQSRDRARSSGLAKIFDF